MITKELFIKCLDIYKNYTDYEDMLANWGVNIWERDEISHFKDAFVELLQNACNDNSNCISSFIYEEDFGKNLTKTVEDLWQDLNKQTSKTEITDASFIDFNESKTVSTEELQEIFFENFSK